MRSIYLCGNCILLYVARYFTINWDIFNVYLHRFCANEQLHSIRLADAKGKIGPTGTRLVREFMGNLIVDRPFAKKPVILTRSSASYKIHKWNGNQSLPRYFFFPFIDGMIGVWALCVFIL